MSENTNPNFPETEISGANETNIATDADQKLPETGPARTLGFIIGFFGIYFLVIGLFSILAITVLQNSNISSGAMSDKDIYSLILTFTSILISLSAMFIGYKLIKRLDIGRKLFNVLTIVSILISIAQYTYSQYLIGKSFANMPPELAAAARGSESASSQLVFILPAVLVVIAVILNFGKIKQWFIK